MYVGVRHFELLDESSGLRFPAVVMYPTTEVPAAVKLGTYTEELALDAAIASGKHSLVVISHGSGGSHLVYRMLAMNLARSGSVSAERVAVVGHSLGGYTALAVAGGVPRFPHNSDHIVSVKHDTRVKAVVLMAPATHLFLAEGSLAQVTVPILVITAEHDHHTPAGHAALLADRLPNPASLSHWHVPNAGHFSFLSPFPESLRKPGFLPAFDPEGFDREAFQQEIGKRIAGFLHEAL